MANIQSGFRLYTIKGESTEGTDAAPVVGTDDFVVLESSPMIDPGIEKTPVRVSSPTGVSYGDVVTRKASTWAPQCPLYGVGETAGTIDLPIWVSALLGSCHDVAIGAADPDTADVTPNFREPSTVGGNDASSKNAPSFTVYEYGGSSGPLNNGTRILSKMLGSRVSGFQLRLAVGEIVTLTPTILGVYDKPAPATTDVSGFDFDGALNDWIVPNAMACTITPNGGLAITMNLSEFVLDVQFAAEHIAGDGAPSGVVAVAQKNVVVTGSMNPLIDSGDIAKWWDTIDENIQCSFAMTANGAFPSTRSGGEGYGVKVAMPAITFNGRNDASGAAMRIAGPFHAGAATAAGAPYTISLQ